MSDQLRGGRGGLCYMSEADTAELFVQTFAQEVCEQKAYVEIAVRKMSSISLTYQLSKLSYLRSWLAQILEDRLAEQHAQGVLWKDTSHGQAHDVDG